MVNINIYTQGIKEGQAKSQKLKPTVLGTFNLNPCLFE